MLVIAKKLGMQDIFPYKLFEGYRKLLSLPELGDRFHE